MTDDFLDKSQPQAQSGNTNAQQKFGLICLNSQHVKINTKEHDTIGTNKFKACDQHMVEIT